MKYKCIKYFPELMPWSFFCRFIRSDLQTELLDNFESFWIPFLSVYQKYDWVYGKIFFPQFSYQEQDEYSRHIFEVQLFFRDDSWEMSQYIPEVRKDSLYRFMQIFSWTIQNMTSSSWDWDIQKIFCHNLELIWVPFLKLEERESCIFSPSSVSQ